MIDKEQRRTLKPVPTVHPTEKQFDDPIIYLSSPEIQKLGQKYGMVKVKPPESWKPPFSIDTNSFKFKPRMQKLSDLSLLNRVRSLFKDGLMNLMKMKKKKIPRTPYIILKNKEKLYYYDLFLKLNQYITKHYDKLEQDTNDHDNNGRNTVYNEVRNYSEIWKTLNHFYKLSPNSNEIIEFYNNYMKEYCIFLARKYSSTIASFESAYEFNQNPYNEDESEFEEEGEESAESDEEDYFCQICGSESDESNLLLCDGCNKGFHTYCLNPKLKKVPKAAWFCDECLVGTGEYGFVTSDTAYSLDEFKKLNDEFKEKYFENIVKDNRHYTLSRINSLASSYLENEVNEEKYVDFLENEFWENLINNDQSNIKVNYGADIHNLKPGQISGFPMNYPFKEELANNEYVNHSFNLTKLPFAKGSLLNHLNDRISGMTIPWLYIGSLFSTFCWHLEDHYMLSANYCHYGDIKKWYCIPESNCNRFEILMKDLAPDLFLRQPDLLHQLVTQLSPYDILKNNIECYYANQKPGEFIVTFPKCYHAGFNCGFNINEAVNFSNNDWLRFGINALDDYKLVKKPPVFSQVHLCYSILHHFLYDNKDKFYDDENLINEENHNLLILCIAYLEKSAVDFKENFKNLSSGDLKTPKIIYTNDFYNDSKLSNFSFDINAFKNLDKFYDDSANESQRKTMTMSGNKPEDIICFNCREICYTSYAEIFSKVGTISPKQDDEIIKEEDETNYLATPEPSPDSKKYFESVGKKRRKKSNVVFIKENIQHYCLEHYNLRQENLKKKKFNENSIIYVRCDDNKIEKLIKNCKDKLHQLKVN